MKAMVLNALCQLEQNPAPLQQQSMPDPTPTAHQLLLQVITCGVCHTELDEIEGRLPPSKLPIILGHQVVGNVVARGDAATQFNLGDRVGVGWIHSACGHCHYCQAGDDNLCPQFSATGRDHHGGYAEYMTVPEQFAFAVPDVFTHEQAAPLLCAGAIGYRALRLCALRDGDSLGLTGFGASAHLVLKMAKFQYPNSPIFVHARSEKEQQFARDLGADWAGDTNAKPPQLLHALIDTTPAWRPMLAGLTFLAPGGRLVINAIRKENTDKDALLSLDYPTHLWMEKEIKSVANVSRNDIRDFFALAANIGIQPEYETYPLTDANAALCALKKGHLKGAKVLCVH